MSSRQPRSLSRRKLLTGGVMAVGGLSAVAPLQMLCERVAQGEPREGAGYGPLEPVNDLATGLPLAKLPRGFRYISFGWRGDQMSDGRITPSAHDGMAVVKADGDLVTLVRNQEVKSDTESFAESAVTYDPRAAGGTVNLVFNTQSGKLEKSWASLGGTSKNCAGGPTPWGTWLSCEETVLGPGDLDDESRSHPGQVSNEKSTSKSKKDPRLLEYTKTHGWIFEVPADGNASPVALEAMGRFVHEAVAVDPRSGIVYETQDAGQSGFYRFLPAKPGQLTAGGKLEMLCARGRDELHKGVRPGDEFRVTWTPINDPTRAHRQSDRNDGEGVFAQGHEHGGTRFARLEGCWYHNGEVYFVSTSGGDKKMGQIWQYTPKNETLRLLFQSPGAAVLESPDNITVSRSGGLVLCEDGDRRGQRLHGLSTGGELFTLAENNVQLSGERNGLRGDFRHEEWCGATFSPDGRWLFVNLQTPGITLAITGPWETGPLA